MATDSSYSANGYVLNNFAAQNPLTIESNGTLIPTGTYAVGVYGTAGSTWTLVNYGLISTPGVRSAGVYFPGGGVVINQSDGVISANPTSGYAVADFGGGVVNQSGASILGNQGIFGRNAALEVVNAGVISGSSNGILLDGGGAVTNQAHGVIAGTDGVYARYAALTVTNAGTIVAGKYGVLLTAGGAITNQPSGVIAGGVLGVFGANESLTVANYGTIQGNPTSGAGVYFQAGGALTNLGTGDITGKFGVFAYGTVLNGGTIAGYGGLAVYLTPSHANRLIIEPEAVFNGLADGGSVPGATIASTLELASGASAGTLQGLGANYFEFADVTIDAGASWTLSAGVLGAGYGIADAGTLTNTGELGSAVALDQGAVLSNAASGTISSGGALAGVYVAAAATALNAGTIEGSSNAVYLGAGGTLTNLPGGTIIGATYGVMAVGPMAATVTNQGSIIGQTHAGVGMFNGGGVSNAGTGVITGGIYGIEASDHAAAIVNDGSIVGQTIAGVVMFAGGSVSNAGSGRITGGYYGVAAATVPVTLTNQGSIAGTDKGVLLRAGGYVTNAVTGTITGGYFGAQLYGTANTFTNLGSISSSATFASQANFDAAGVNLADGGTVINGPTGDIRATWKGVEIGAVTSNVGGTVLNQGTIFASNSLGNTGAAVWIHGPGLISNAATGTIAGGPYAIVAYYQTTLINLGTIIGTEFAFDAANTGVADRVVVGPGAVFAGLVKGGGPVGGTAVSTLELASGAGAGTLTDLGGNYFDFGDITIDAGATWTLGSDRLSAGYAIADAGTLTNTGSLGSAVTLGAGAVLTNAEGGTISASGTPSVYAAAVATVVNAGSIGGAVTSSIGIDLRAGGSVTNQANGLISGYRAVVVTMASGTVVNAGSIGGDLSAGASHISGAIIKGAGVYLSAGGSVTNQSGGTISGYRGVAAYPGIVTVVNLGVITGAQSGAAAGVAVVGGSVANAASARITGYIGVEAATLVANAGSIGGTAAGVYLNVADGRVTNHATGVISGRYGIAAGGAAALVVNAGSIGGTSIGIHVAKGGSVTNQSGGTVSGASDAVKFAAGYSNLLVVDPGAAFVGTVDGGNTIGAASISTLELASGSGVGTLSGLGTRYINFADLTIDSAASWSLTNSSTSATVATLNNAGTLDVSGDNLADTGALANSGVLEATGGTLTLDGSISGTGALALGTGGTLRLHQPIGSLQSVAFTAGTSETLVLDSPGSGLSNAVTGFAVGDRIELGDGAQITAASFISAHEIKLVTNTGSYLLSDITTSSGGILDLAVGTDATTGDSYVEAIPSQIFVWTDASNSNLANAANWDDVSNPADSGVTLPGAADTAEFLTAGSVVISGTAAVGVLQFGSGGLWSLGTGTTLTAGSAVTVGNGVVSLDGGAAIAGAGSVDVISGTGGLSAVVTVFGSDTTWNDAGTLVVGGAGLGELSIQGDGTVISGAGTIANTSTAAGSAVNVSGAGSDWKVSGALDVGNAGAASLDITAGGTVSATTLNAAAVSGSDGVISISGNNSSLITAGTLSVGTGGAGELSILSGANVNIGGDFDIGTSSGASGNVDIEDTSGTVFVGGNLNLGVNGGVAVLTVGYGSTLEVDNGGVNGGPNAVLIPFSPIDPFYSNGVTYPISSTQVQSFPAYVADSRFNLSQGVTYTLETPAIYAGSGFEIGAGTSDTEPTELVLNAGSFSANSSVTFESAVGTLVVGVNALATIATPISGTSSFTKVVNPDAGVPLIGSFDGTLKQFQAGDVIIVDTSVAATFSQSGSIVSVIANGTTLGALTFDSVAAASAATSSGLENEVVAAPCFAAGTRIATARGEVAVEDLAVGDLVPVVLGDPLEPIVWIGQRSVNCARHPKPAQVWPVRIAAGAFGPGQPHTELWLSPDHAVYVNDVLIPVRHLINATTIVQVAVDTVTYYHVELPRHDVVLAEGLAVESYLDMKDGSNYANRPGPVRLYPDFSTRMWEAFGCAPLIVTGPELEAARRSVNALAPPSCHGRRRPATHGVPGWVRQSRG